MLWDQFLMKKLLWNLWDREQCTDTPFTKEKSKHAAQEKKKKREGKHANEQNVNVLCIQTAPNSHIMKYIGNGKYFYIKYFVIKEHGILLGNCQTSRVKNWTIKEVQFFFFCFFPKILRRCLKLLFKQ